MDAVNKVAATEKTVNALSKVAVTGVAVKEKSKCHKRQTVNAVTKLAISDKTLNAVILLAISGCKRHTVKAVTIVADTDKQWMLSTKLLPQKKKQQ